ncbi:hypothetical protein CNMCM5793_004158 [Aspergillus hiratsukae]|uniref:Uncharacterized protein n=1 Tax=Aspergillus hiratsukae TaxID=1194566 RepID=A0A8H6P3M1_9EURO|nr:hypothetical protein CNMCM5793_004158 [Aspergillus hiratsukae]KAF7159117.1 hypothetical protein CNMCM6106_006202 [Aspergillus hiratsukae]
MIAPNEVGDGNLASPSIPRRRKPPKLRHERPLQDGLDGAVEKVLTDDTLSAQQQPFIPKTSDDESDFEDASEGDFSASEPELQPAPQRQRQTHRDKPFRDEEDERSGAPDDDVLLTAGRQRRRRGRRGKQQVVQLNTVDNIGRTVGQSGDLVRSTTDRGLGTLADTGGRALARQSERNEVQKKDDDEHLRLRLDLNLDLEVQLKAKITGDLTLSLLLVPPLLTVDSRVYY